MAIPTQLLDLALRHHQSGELAQAVSLYRQALSIEPQHAGLHNNLGVALKGMGQTAEAIDCYRQALRIDPQYADALDNLGMALRDQGQVTEAAECCLQALQINPAHPQARISLGSILQDQGKPQEAIDCYRQALQLHPQNPSTHFNLGTVLMSQGRLDEAIACFRRALHFRPDYAKAHINLGNALQEQGKLADAAECFRQAVRINPASVEAINNLGNSLVGQGLLVEGAECFRQTLVMDPGNKMALWNRSLLLLRQGDFKDAWPGYEQRWALPNWPAPIGKGPRWDGSSLQNKTILVYYEQGFGDTIQFLRFLPMVKERGGTVLFSCQPALQKLLLPVAGVDHLTLESAVLPPYDVQIPLLSLPGVFNTTLATIPAQVPYLQADPQQVSLWRQELAALDGFKVGIAWQGNPKVPGDRLRSISLEYFESLASIPRVKLVSLQKGKAAEQLRGGAGRLHVLDLSQRLASFSDTAAVMKNLDLVVTSDSSVAHLAGALGVPVWTALQLVPDWRWFLERADSPWYPTMRLFRQKRLGDWQEVFTRIAVELRVASTN